MKCVIDTETALIEQGRLAPPMTCLQFVMDSSSGAHVAVVDVDSVQEILEELLTYDEIIGHNIAFDMLVIIREFPDLTKLVFKAYEELRVNDTMIRERLIRIREGTLKHARSFSLSALAEKYGSAKKSDDPWRMRYSELRGIPTSQWPVNALTYAKQDVIATRHVYESQGSDIIDDTRQTKAAFILHCVGAAGVHTDPGAYSALRSAVERQHEEDLQFLQHHGLVRKNGKRNLKAAREYMADVLGEDCLLTAKGNVSLSEEACNLSNDSVLLAYQRYGSHSNFLTRIESLTKGFDKPLNPRFTSVVETGRTSCSKGEYGYQIQNMMRLEGERECFVPRPGNTFLAIDFCSFELCSLAQVCIDVVGYSKLGEAINRGLDPHLAVVANAWGQEYSDLLCALHDETQPDHKKVKLARQGAKIANFGFPGGMGPQAFRRYARGYGMNLEYGEADALRGDMFRAYPEISSYFKWLDSHHTWNSDSRTTIQQLRSGRIRGGVTYTAAANSFFQGLAADAAKEAGFALVRACELGPLKGWSVWNFVHDEYILEGPTEDGPRAAEITSALMIDGAQKWIPDIKITTEATLMERWYKV